MEQSAAVATRAEFSGAREGSILTRVASARVRFVSERASVAAADLGRVALEDDTLVLGAARGLTGFRAVVELTKESVGA